MSWSVDYTGTPAKVADALEKHAEVNKLTGDCLTEYEAARPALVALVGLNYNRQWPGFAIRIVASGHTAKGTSYEYSNCMVKLEAAGNVVT